MERETSAMAERRARRKDELLCAAGEFMEGKEFRVDVAAMCAWIGGFLGSIGVDRDLGMDGEIRGDGSVRIEVVTNYTVDDVSIDVSLYLLDEYFGGDEDLRRHRFVVELANVAERTEQILDVLGRRLC